LEEQVRALNLTPHVVFAGFVPRPELPQHYRQADAFVFASLWNELFGCLFAEAMATEVPAVCTRVAGVPEVVEDGKTALMVERGNVAALTEAILSLLENEERRRQMGQAGRQRALELFSWDRVAEALSRHYNELNQPQKVNKQEETKVA
jgi:spore coat protein SA